MKYLLALLAIGIGVTGMVAGEADDSPGLQLLGLVLIVGGVALGERMARRQPGSWPGAYTEAAADGPDSPNSTPPGERTSAMRTRA